MLKKINIENFGIIGKSTLNLSHGLNVLTGETGTGKSMVLNAIRVALGEKSSPMYIRKGEEDAKIELLFHFTKDKAERIFEKILEEFSGQFVFSLLPDLWEAIQKNELRKENLEIPLQFSREIFRNKTSRSYINGVHVNLNQVKRLSRIVIEIHGQYQTQNLLQTSKQIEYLDSFAGSAELAQEVRDIYAKQASLLKKIDEGYKKSKQKEEKTAMIQFALQQINNLNPSIEEYQKIKQERHLIKNANLLFQDLHDAYQKIKGGPEPILQEILQIEENLEEHSLLLEDLNDALSMCREAKVNLDELSDRLREETTKLDFSPDRLEIIDKRLAFYHSVCKQYGGSADAVQEVLEKKQEYKQELQDMENMAEDIAKLKKEYKMQEKELLQKARKLSQMRTESIPNFEKKVSEIFNELGLIDAAILVENDCAMQLSEILADDDTNSMDDINPTDDTDDMDIGDTGLPKTKNITKDGFDKMEFLFNANKGEEFHLLNSVVSGGELSRIVLALKSVLNMQEQFPCLIFDEIDTGIGGDIAHQVALKLKQLSTGSQIIVITHLQQVAKRADSHFYIYKEIKNDRTFSQVKLLDETERLDEIKRMLGLKQQQSIVSLHDSDNPRDLQKTLEYTKNMYSERKSLRNFTSDPFVFPKNGFLDEKIYEKKIG